MNTEEIEQRLDSANWALEKHKLMLAQISAGLDLVKEDRDQLRARVAELESDVKTLRAALEKSLFAIELVIAPYIEIPEAHISDSTKVARIAASQAKQALAATSPTP